MVVGLGDLGVGKGRSWRGKVSRENAETTSLYTTPDVTNREAGQNEMRVSWYIPRLVDGTLKQAGRVVLASLRH